ncbi:hypothetical protein HMPREF0573_10228 [Mobiluncus curtisii ATCC 43063]|uniref:Uncharacterized protein n=1 Tax=Mobiluncus curtisii (strain ATCC 43063 / DSM 2711 / V125) TaxID=548479 RepID=D6ZIJ8_MOBCV|nr:hypothetical protein HMPREF0573_10228 [Mobiluncus curtisii ATCC 43063]
MYLAPDFRVKRIQVLGVLFSTSLFRKPIPPTAIGRGHPAENSLRDARPETNR